MKTAPKIRAWPIGALALAVAVLREVASAGERRNILTLAGIGNRTNSLHRETSAAAQSNARADIG